MYREKLRANDFLSILLEGCPLTTTGQKSIRAPQVGFARRHPHFCPIQIPLAAPSDWEAAARASAVEVALNLEHATLGRSSCSGDHADEVCTGSKAERKGADSEAKREMKCRDRVSDGSQEEREVGGVRTTSKEGERRAGQWVVTSKECG